MAVAQPYREATVYESTASGLPQLRPYLTDLWGRRRFIWHLARTDLKAEHYDSAIGQVWVVLDPLLMAAVYFLLRTVVRPSGSASARSAIIAHLVWAVFFFTFVSNAMQTGARSLLSGRNLILNASFPRAVLPLVSIVKSVFDFLPTMLVYFAVHAVLGQPFGLSLIMLPVVIVTLTLMNIGLAMLFAP
ncbi:MAG TPA: ABC transporter permease, partial [Acidimicrobiia bacterium]|nr:ABC transporter permease [Acidimicrobiia bacterium]